MLSKTDKHLNSSATVLFHCISTWWAKTCDTNTVSGFHLDSTTKSIVLEHIQSNLDISNSVISRSRLYRTDVSVPAADSD